MFKINNIAKSEVAHCFQWHRLKGSDHRESIIGQTHCRQFKATKWLWLLFYCPIWIYSFLLEIYKCTFLLFDLWEGKVDLPKVNKLKYVAMYIVLVKAIKQSLGSQHFYNLIILRGNELRPLWGGVKAGGALSLHSHKLQASLWMTLSVLKGNTMDFLIN